MDTLTDTFAALADPTRRAILSRLSLGDATVGELAHPFTISGPAISRHLRVLEQAGLIRRQIDAQWRLCRLQALPLQAAHDWLDHYRVFWETSLDRLVDLVEGGDVQLAPARQVRTRRNQPAGATTQAPRRTRKSR